MKKTFIFAVLLLVTYSLWAQLDFSYEQAVFRNITMPYRKALIAQDNEGLSSLVIYLHGGSSKGDDNEAQLQEPGTDSIANYLVRKNKKSIFVVPQCPTNYSWGGPMNNAIEAMLDSLLSPGLVDSSRIYIFGGSMGGTGTWGMVSAYPEMFAAAMPVAGNPSRGNAESVSSTPVYTVMGTADAIMSIDVVEEFLQSLEENGGEYMFDIEEGWTHEQTCIESYTEVRLDWVFSHPADGQGGDPEDNPTAVGNYDYSHEIVTVRYYDLLGRILNYMPDNGMFIMEIVYSDGTVSREKILGNRYK